MGYPAFYLEVSNCHGIFEKCVSAIGYVGFTNAFEDFTTDLRQSSVRAHEADGRIRPCTIIPRGHPARSWE